jgi:hypothetical protein
LGKPKVRQLDIGIIPPILQQQIFRLQVPVDHLRLMAIMESIKQNPDQVPRLLLVIALLLHNPVKQFPPQTNLQHQIILLPVLVKIKQLHNVVMLHVPQNRHFLLQGLIVLHRQLRALHHLDGSLAAVGLTRAFIHNRIGPRAQFLPQGIFTFKAAGVA